MFKSWRDHSKPYGESRRRAIFPCTWSKNINRSPYEILGQGRGGHEYYRMHTRGSALPTLELLNPESCAYARAEKWIGLRGVLRDGRTKARVTFERAIELLRLSR